MPREDNLQQKLIAPNLPHDLDVFRTLETDNVLELLSVGHPEIVVVFFLHNQESTV